jgi:hypothetical protein
MATSTQTQQRGEGGNGTQKYGGLNEMARKQKARDDGDLRKYFAMIPHLVDDADIDPYAYRVYGHLKREAGQNGEVELSSRRIAYHCKMSAARVVTAKRDLVDANLISVIPGGDGFTDTIVILDIWRENILRYAPESDAANVIDDDRSRREHPRSPQEHQRSGDEHPRSRPEHPVSPREHPRSGSEHPRSPGERSEEYIDINILKQEKKGNDASDDAPPLEEFIEELCLICYGHKETTSITEKDIGTLHAEGKKIRAAGFDIADLRDWMTGHWFKDWRWKKDQQRPTPALVRSSIAKVRAVGAAADDAARRAEYSAYDHWLPPLEQEAQP